MVDRKSALGVLAILWISCATVQPTVAPLVIFVNHDSGGDWPIITNARIYADGTLELGDGPGQRRKRVSVADPLFQRVTEAIESEAFRTELAESAPPPTVLAVIGRMDPCYARRRCWSAQTTVNRCPNEAGTF